MQFQRDEILAAVAREARVDRRVWESQRLFDDQAPEDESPFFDEAIRARTSRSLEHVFTMLSLVLPRRPLEIAYRGLYASDQNLRGTALEYLEVILPAEIRAPGRPTLHPVLDEVPRGDPRLAAAVARFDRDRSRGDSQARAGQEVIGLPRGGRAVWDRGGETPSFAVTARLAEHQSEAALR